MKKGRFNVVIDGQFGSTGKGLISTYLADIYRPQIISSTNMANAGHTAIDEDGKKFIGKSLPTPAILSAWRDYNPQVVIGPSAAFHLNRILEEINTCQVNETCIIHQRAGVITEKHINVENSENGTSHLASTRQGCGAFLSDKIMRHKTVKLARDYEELTTYTQIESLHMWLNEQICAGSTILHEGSQGFSLDINHGHSYPQCTSRGTTAVQNLADMGIAPHLIGDVYMVMRPYPIRVGNIVENDKMIGYSGDSYDDSSEISWEEVAKRAGAPQEVTQGETTTVTGRLRRVFEYSTQQINEAVVVNGVTKIALNFANYIDWACYGTNNFDTLPPKVIDFIHKIEDDTARPVVMVGTGPQNNHICHV